MADIRPSTHPDGVLRGEARLDEGLYTVIIATEKQNLMRRPQYLLRVQMTDYQKLVRTVAGPLLGVLLVAWLGYRLIRSKWLRNWRTGSTTVKSRVLSLDGYVNRSSLRLRGNGRTAREMIEVIAALMR